MFSLNRNNPHENWDPLKEVDVVRQEAEGCRLQGGPDQLAKALLKYDSVLEALDYLRDECGISSKWTVIYSKCLLGSAIVYLNQDKVSEAEPLMWDSLQTLSLFVAGAHAAYGQNTSDSLLLHEQLLSMFSCAVKDFYFRAAGDTAHPDNLYLFKASILLHWYADLLLGDVSPLTTSVAEAVTGQGSDFGIAERLNASLTALVSRKLPIFSTKRAVLLELLTTASALNARLNAQHASVALFQHGLAQAEPDPLIGQQLNDTETHSLGDMRRGCIRCALQCCRSVPCPLDEEARLRTMRDMEGMLSSLAYFEGRRDAELWADLFVLKGGVENEILGFCLYAACYSNHGRGDNSDMTRLKDKMALQEAQVLPQLNTWCVGRDETAPYLKIMIQENVVNVFMRAGAGRVVLTANASKLRAILMLQSRPMRLNVQHGHDMNSVNSSRSAVFASNTAGGSSVVSSLSASVSSSSPSSNPTMVALPDHVVTVEYDESSPDVVTLDGVAVQLANAVLRSYPYFVHNAQPVFGSLLHLAVMRGLVALVRKLGGMAKELRAQGVGFDFSEQADSHNFSVAQRCSHFKSFSLTFPYFCMAYEKDDGSESIQWTAKERLYSDFLQGDKAALDDFSSEALSTPLYYYWSYEGLKIYGTLLHFTLYHSLRDKACYLVRRRVSESVPDSGGFSVLDRINDQNPAARVWVAGFKAEYDAAKSAAAEAVLQDFAAEKYGELEGADYLSADHLVGWGTVSGEMFEGPGRGRHEVRGTLLHYALHRQLKPQLLYLGQRAGKFGINYALMEDSDLLTPMQRCGANESFAEGIDIYIQAYGDGSVF